MNFLIGQREHLAHAIAISDWKWRKTGKTLTDPEGAEFTNIGFDVWRMIGCMSQGTRIVVAGKISPALKRQLLGYKPRIAKYGVEIEYPKFKIGGSQL